MTTEEIDFHSKTFAIIMSANYYNISVSRFYECFLPSWIPHARYGCIAGYHHAGVTRYHSQRTSIEAIIVQENNKLITLFD